MVAIYNSRNYKDFIAYRRSFTDANISTIVEIIKTL